MDVERGDDDVIDQTLLECFLELSLRQRIESAANYANAVARLRRIRPTEASERAT